MARPPANAQPVPPPNDVCSAATALTLNVPVYGDNAAATSINDGPAAPCERYSTSRAVWFTFTPATTQRYQISACFTRYNSVLTVFQTVDCTTYADSAFVIAPGGCNDDECGTGPGPGGAGNELAPLISSMPLSAGTTYYIRLSGENPVISTGQYQLAVYDFISYGACCSSVGDCTMVLPQGCGTTGTSLFLGAGTTCSPSPCTGACCNNTTFSCTATGPDVSACGAGATWQGFRSTCAANVCVSGACCSLSGVCTTTTLGECASGGPPNNLASAWNAGVACSGVGCYPVGACCDRATLACTLLSSGTTCPTGAAFAGFGTTCAPATCTLGVCCSLSLTCILTLPSECNNNTTSGYDQSSKWNPSTTCSGSPCTMACCNNTTFICTVATSGPFCPAGSTSIGLGSACGPDACASGGCCAADGTCTLTAAQLCSRANQFAGVGTACAPSACTTACCNNTTGACSVVSMPAPSTCTGLGLFSVCSPTPCAAMGACCASDHSCTYTIAATCASTFQGTATVCSPNPCTGGACCNTATAVCTFTDPNGCASGTFHGLGTACDPSPCPSGACCNPSSTACTLTGVGGCAFVFHGLGSTCSPNPCAGACCSASTGACTLTYSLANCQTSADLTFQGLSTVCSPTPCPPAPAPANDTCAAAHALTLNLPFGGDNSFATGDGLEGPAGSCYFDDVTPGDGPTHFRKAVWFAFTAPATTRYQISTCGSTFETVLSAFQPNGDPSCDTLSSLACNQNGCFGGGLPSPAAAISSVTFEAGQTYFIRLASWGAAGGVYTIIVQYAAGATVGACCDATTCTLTDIDNCALAYTAGSVCTSNPCAPSGVCCRGATCTTSITSSAACAATVAGTLAGASFSNGGACNSGNTSPCCYANYNKTGGLSVQDIFDFLNDWFAGRKFAIVGGNGTSGSLTVQNIFDFLNAWFAGGC